MPPLLLQASTESHPVPKLFLKPKLFSLVHVLQLSSSNQHHHNITLHLLLVTTLLFIYLIPFCCSVKPNLQDRDHLFYPIPYPATCYISGVVGHSFIPLIGAQGTAKQTMCICLIKMFYFNRIRGLSVLIKQKVPRYIRLLP